MRTTAASCGPFTRGSGVTVSKAAIPVMRPVFPTSAAIGAYLDEADRAGWFSNFGPLSRRLERRVADHVGTDADHVVAVSNATLGLLGALSISDTASWVLPSWTFTATTAAAIQSGRAAAFVDVDATDWWVHDRGGSDRGVVRVAPFGDRVHSESGCADGEVVIDAAASLGSVEDLLGDLTPPATVVFSLHATKVLGAGEGGIVVFGDPERAARFRAWTNYGFDGSRASEEMGLNAKMSEPAAACALAALDGWSSERDEWLAARRLADRATLNVGLPGAPGQVGRVGPYWIVVFPDRHTLEAATSTLAECGIDSRRWWGAGCHQMAAYSHLPRAPLPVTEQLADTVLGLPMYRRLSATDVDRISRALDAVRFRTRTW